MNNLAPVKEGNLNYPIYLDYQSTTPIDPRVVDAMMPYLTDKFGNPHSRSHSFGWEAEDATDIARENIANLINANPKEIIFTSGATESNNMAIKGVARFYGEKKNHIITVATEHKCVLDACRHVEREGMEITYLGVKENGLIDLDELNAASFPHPRAARLRATVHAAIRSREAGAGMVGFR